MSQKPLQAEGHFLTEIDPSSIELKDLPGNRCEFSVNATATFTGTLSGQADGRTTAIIFTTCENAGSNPPGTFRDIFGFDGEFVGTVAGAATAGPLAYAGVTAPGGDVMAGVHFDGEDTWALLRAEGTVAGGSDYSGIAKPK